MIHNTVTLNLFKKCRWREWSNSLALMSIHRDISVTVEDTVDEIENSCQSFKFIFTFILLQIIYELNTNLKKPLVVYY